MKKFLLSTVALATMTAGAMAADLPVRTMAPAYVPVPVFTWTGGYIGVNLGGAWNGNDRDDFAFGNRYTTAAGFPVDAGGGGVLGLGGDNNDVRILGGVQAGYNWQFTPGSGFVLGVEGDIQWIGRNNDRGGFLGFGGADAGFATATPNPQIALPRIAAPGNVAFFGNEGLLGRSGGGDNWFATARLRAGYAVDRALFYVTGGLAFKDSKDNNNGFVGARNFGGSAVGVAAVAPTFFVPGSPLGVVGTNNVFIGNNDDNNIGWALGLGMEYAFTNNLSAKIEYLHVEFDRNKNHFGAAQVVGVTNTGAAIVNNGNFGGRREASIDLVRAGLNFRFSGW